MANDFNTEIQEELLNERVSDDELRIILERLGREEFGWMDCGRCATFGLIKG